MILAPGRLARVVLNALPLLAALAIGASVLAQDFGVRRYTELDGLPSTEVRTLARDATGRVWFATRKGIASYDGRRWTPYTVADGLPSSDQSLLAFDGADRLWAVSHGEGPQVAVFENERWASIATLDPEIGEATSILPISGGPVPRAWLGTQGGLFVVDAERVSRVTTAGHDTPWVFDLLSWKERTLVATDRGLLEARLDGSTARLVPIDGAPTGATRAMAADADGAHVALVGADWFGTFDGTAFSGVIHRFPELVTAPTDFVTAEFGPNGGLYFGASSALYFVDPDGELVRFGAENGLTGEGANDVLADGDVVWIGGARGVSKIVSLRFSNYRKRHGLLEDEVTGILERRDGAVVLGHAQGLTFFGPHPTRLRLDDSIDARVLDLAEDARGNLFVAMRTAGLYRINPDGEVHEFPARPEWRGQVTSVAVDPDDRVWVATRGGIYRLDGDDFVEQPIPESAGGASVRRLFIDSDGRVVAGMVYRGLLRLEDGSWRRWASGRTSSDNVYAFLDRGDASPWVGSTAGLFTTDGDRLVRVETPRIDRPVYFIERDTEHRVWFGTDNGVLRWDGESLRHFTVSHGLGGRETNRAAGHVDARGWIWIGTDGGLSVYRPELDRGPEQPPQITLVGATVAGRLDPLTSSLSLPHDRSSIAFDYRVASFVDEREVQIRSRLLGLQEQWQPAMRPHEWSIRYDHLAPGTYQLQLQATSIDGFRSEVATSPTIVVLRPFWQRAWFYAIVMAALVLTGFVSHSLLSHRRNARRLEREVAERVSELRRTEERHGVTLGSIGEGVIATDSKGTVTLMNAAAESITGLHAAEETGRDLGAVFARLQVDRVATDEMLRAALDGIDWSTDEPLTFVTPDGSVRRIGAGCTPLRHGTSVQGAVLVIRDVTAQHRDRQQIIEEEKRWRMLVENAPICIQEIDLSGCVTSMNPSGFGMLGDGGGDPVIGTSFLDLVGGDDRARVGALLQRAIEGHTVEFEFTGSQLDAPRIYWSSFVPIRAADGTISRLMGLSEDVTDRRNAERRQRIMVNELDHRVKNNLQAVLSLAERSVAKAETLQEFRSSFSGRIVSMARTHEALARVQWNGVSIHELVRIALDPFLDRDGRLLAEGPATQLPAPVVSPVGLALHELATNAFKHGALSSTDGRVEITWRRHRGSLLDLAWVETGGPPPAGRHGDGLGLQLVRGLIESQLSGSFEVEFAHGGIRCRIAVPEPDEVGPSERERHRAAGTREPRPATVDATMAHRDLRP